MDSFLSTNQIDDLRRRYAAAWNFILTAYNRDEAAHGRPTVTKAVLAERFGVSDATVSRAMSGNGVPMSQGLLVEIAEFLRASNPRIRALLSWAHALSAADATPPKKGSPVDERKVAKYYAKMHDPLYEETKVAEKMVSAQSSAYHAMLDLGIDSNLAAKAAIDAEDCGTFDEAVSRIVFNEVLFNAIPSENLRMIPVLKKVYSHFVVVDLFGPCAKPPPRFLQRAEKRRECIARTWQATPHLTVTRLEMTQVDKAIRDGQHRGLEALLLLEGAGTFEMREVGQIKLKKGWREMIAYRAVAPHKFKADILPTTLCVINYDRAEQTGDPTADLFA